MKTYLAITGLLFGLLTVVHIWRMFVEPELAQSLARSHHHHLGGDGCVGAPALHEDLARSVSS